MGELILLRHGETEWSLAGKHTGRTDIPLTREGEAAAKALAPMLSRRDIVAVFTSPARRAVTTAAFAGLSNAKPDPELWEWDYGGYEGLTTEQILKTRPGWYLWRDGVIRGDAAHPGETIEQVAHRVGRMLARVVPMLSGGDVALVAHGHVLRVLTACYLRQPPAEGRLFRLDTGTAGPWAPNTPSRSSRPGMCRPRRSASARPASDALGRAYGPGLLPYPVQVRGRARHDGQRDDLGLVIAVPFGDEGGEFVVAVGRQLEEHEPLLGALQRVVPPVHRRHRPGHLRARGQPGFDRGAGELHRLGARIGRRLHLEVLRLKVGHGT